MHLNHPETIPHPPGSVGKLSSTKLVPGAQKVGVCWLRAHLSSNLHFGLSSAAIRLDNTARTERQMKLKQVVRGHESERV